MKPHFLIHWTDEVDSTNNELLRGRDTLPGGYILAARHQTAGRGQRGNDWKDSKGENLTFSALLRPGSDGLPAIAARDQFTVSEAAAVSVRDLLRAHGAKVKVKWPNDIYFRDKKICGMLIENSLAGEDVAVSIVGIGININQKEFSPALMNPTSLTLITGETYGLEELLDEFAEIFSGRLALTGDTEGRARLRADYLDGMYRLEEEHDYALRSDGSTFRGTIKGISEEGMLLVEMPDKTLKSFGFKDISYII